MGFKKGDIIEYCGELFEVLKNYGNSGSVIQVNDDFERITISIGQLMELNVNWLNRALSTSTIGTGIELKSFF